MDMTEDADGRSGSEDDEVEVEETAPQKRKRVHNEARCEILRNHEYIEKAVKSIEEVSTGQATSDIIEQVMWQEGIPKSLLNKQLLYLESPGNRHENLAILISFLTVISQLHWRSRVV
jgi:hypothetical protein